MALNPSNDVKDFAAGESLSSIIDSVVTPTGNQPPEVKQPEPKVENKPAENKAAPPVVEDEVEYEGKKYKVEKSAKDLLIEALNAKKGMRKAFAERDKELKKFKEREQDLTRYDQIMSTFKTKGYEGLYDALAGQEGAYQAMMKKSEERILKKYNATEDELRLIQQEELLEKERSLRELAEKTQRETLERIQAKEEEAQKSVLSSRLNEAFETVSFEGKLGDEKREDKFNRYIWEQARVQLKEYADSKGIPHHEIPSKVIKSTFEEVASDFKDVITKQAATEVVKQTQTASDAATLAAQASSKSTTKPDNSIEALAEKYKNPHEFLSALFGG